MKENFLTLIRETGRGKFNEKIGLFKCKCGKEKEIPIYRVNGNQIRSCGCLMGQGGKKHGLSRHPLYLRWMAIFQRCYNEKCENYKKYGARGVIMCEEWKNDFMLFYNWAIENGWRKGLHIDKDIKGTGLIYSPQTCSIVTLKENSNHTRQNKYIEFYGLRMSLSKWAERVKMPSFIINSRLRYGWSVKDALTKRIALKGSAKNVKHIEIKHTFGFIN